MSGPSSIADSPLAQMRAGLDACVHCGFCLQSCPTYLALEDENDSPRGRLLIMRGVLEGDLAPTDRSVQQPISRCLGCRACETACPSGVPYGHLLEATRATLAAVQPIPRVARLILWVFERTRVLDLALFGARMLRGLRVSALLSRLPGRLGFAFAMLESTRPAFAAPDVDGLPAGPNRSRVVLLEGCVMRGLFAGTNAATERVLMRNSYRVVVAEGQGCCGALHAHAGDLAGARRLARANIEAFEAADPDAIVVNSAGCGAMMRDYGHLLGGDLQFRDRAAALANKVRDISELLAEAGPLPGRLAVGKTVAYDPPCHLLHAQRVSAPPLALLKAIPELHIRTIQNAEQCCGAAGIYNLIQPETSNAVLAAKLRNIHDSQADLVATGNPGCLMQIGAGLLRSGSRARAVHPVDLLEYSYRANA